MAREGSGQLESGKQRGRELREVRESERGRQTVAVQVVKNISPPSTRKKPVVTREVDGLQVTQHRVVQGGEWRPSEAAVGAAEDSKSAHALGSPCHAWCIRPLPLRCRVEPLH